MTLPPWLRASKAATVDPSRALAMIGVTSVAGIVATFPRTAAGLDAAVITARKSARVGENYSGAIDFLLRKPAVSRPCSAAPAACPLSDRKDT